MVSLSAIIFFVILGSAFAATVPEEKSPKVVNGTEADIAEFPFMVSLRRNGGHSCGGSLINSEWILTAAHCLGSPVLNYSVQFANTIISRDGTHVAQVVEKIVHEGYMPSNQYIHDIGLVRLEDPIKSPLSDFSVRLPLSGSYFTTGTPALLTGWGLNGTDGVIMPHLQKVDLQIFSAFDCNELHRSTVHYTNICGGVPEGGKGQCSGLFVCNSSFYLVYQ